MAKRSNQKLKILYIYKILLEQTDSQNGLTLSEISDELQKYGVSAERKTLYDDIEALKLFGVDIATKRDRRVRYYVASRELPLELLKLIGELINSSAAISQKDKEHLIRNFVRQGGRSSASLLRLSESEIDYLQLNTEGRAVICRAIAENKKIKCRVFEYNAQKQRIMQFYGEELILSPWHLELVPTPRFVAYEHKTKRILLLYADRLLGAEIIDKNREGELEFSKLCDDGGLDALLGRPAKIMIRLRCANSLADEIIGKYGRGVTVLGNGEDSFEISLKCSPDNEFFAWVFLHVGKVKILSPESVALEYKKMLDLAIEPDRK